METSPQKNCAIYTRKSSEDGLEQEYNSLDAQRDAGENYVLSQVSAGWELLPDRYDDGGISGGTTERPALQQLIEDIKAGKVDIVVVYKIDRLSRSMFDFLGLIKFFQEHNVSFVSVTQHINTDSAMGRLMLNVLQSFAQFEMEQTGERIRDKIASSKSKGMWMGGNVPLGYDAVDGKLEVNAHEAETVHYIFSSYLKLGSMNGLLADLKAKGHKTKEWITKSGKHYKPKNFSKSSVYRILNNKIYIGKIEHKAADKVYDGLHNAIIEQQLWDDVQALLSGNKSSRPKISDNGDRPYLLKGILENPNGYSMTPSAQRKKDKVYRYYVSMESIKKGAKTCPVKTISAPLIEEIILDRLGQLLINPEWVSQMLKLDENDLNIPALRTLVQEFGVVWKSLFPIEQARITQLLIDKIVLHPDRLLIHFLPLGLVSLIQELKPQLSFDADKLTTNTPVALEIPISFKKRGARKYIKAPNGQDILKLQEPKYDHALIKALVRAHDWDRKLETDKAESTLHIAEREGIRANYVQKIIKLVDLAPDITEAILNGRQPYSLTLSQLEDIPLCWADQRQAYGFSQQPL